MSLITIVIAVMGLGLLAVLLASSPATLTRSTAGQRNSDVSGAAASDSDSRADADCDASDACDASDGGGDGGGGDGGGGE